MKAGKPIGPDDVVAAKTEALPAAVFDAWNALIAAAWTGSYAKVMQEDAAKALVKATGLTRSEVFDSHYLDIEESYRAAGWTVEYDKPGYNESYAASFTFKRARK